MYSLTDQAVTLVDGLMLGRGVHLDKGGRLVMQAPPARAAWVEHVRAALRAVGARSSVATRPPRTSALVGRDSGAVRLITRTYGPLRHMHDRWYHDGVRRVPVTLRLSPRVLALWYWGAGSLARKGTLVRLNAKRFPYTDVQHLARLLHEQYGWRPHIHSGHRLAIQARRDRAELRALVTPLAPTCFRRKLDIR